MSRLKQTAMPSFKSLVNGWLTMLARRGTNATVHRVETGLNEQQVGAPFAIDGASENH
jgi:hypothetical protein